MNIPDIARNSLQAVITPQTITLLRSVILPWPRDQMNNKNKLITRRSLLRKSSIEVTFFPPLVLVEAISVLTPFLVLLKDR